MKEMKLTGNKIVEFYQNKHFIGILAHWRIIIFKLTYWHIGKLAYWQISILAN